ncbi:MAG: MBL fold metallo-hydrolase [Anaerolineae bacterium]
MVRSHPLKIGDITCMVLEEGRVNFDRESILQRYPNATAEEINDALMQLGYGADETLYNYFNALYIETAGIKILVDTGMGYNPERPQVGQLLPSLQEAGIQPDEIDIVYITHFHGDHYMGLLTDGQPTFPNARYLTLKTEWDYWLGDDVDEALAQRVAGIRSVVDPLRDRFETVYAGDEIAPGVHAMALPGHTMGQSGLQIESGDETLLHLVDLLHHPAQFLYPDWQFVWDTDGELAVKTRRAHLGNAINRNLLVMFYHLPFPGLGHVERVDTQYHWEPLSTS